MDEPSLVSFSAVSGTLASSAKGAGMRILVIRSNRRCGSVRSNSGAVEVPSQGQRHSARSFGMYLLHLRPIRRPFWCSSRRKTPAKSQSPQLTAVRHLRFGGVRLRTRGHNDLSPRMATLVSTPDPMAPVPTQQSSPQASIRIPHHTEFPEISTGTMDSVGLPAFGRRLDLVRPSTAGRTHVSCCKEVFACRGSCRSFGHRL